MSRPALTDVAPGVTGELQRIVQLAWPVAIAQLGSMLLGVVDVMMVGHLGEAALSGVMLGHTFAFSTQALLMGAAIGMDPLFAQAYGALQPQRAGASLARGAALMGVMSLPLMALYPFAGDLLAWAGQPTASAAIAGDYSLVRTLSVLPFALLMLLRQFLQASGRMWPGTVAIVLGNLVNVLVNGMLLYGWLGSPVLGPVGAAWATVFSTLAMLLALVVLAWPDLKRARPDPVALRDLAALRRMATICLPVGVQVGLEGWGFSLATVFMGWFGETALAAHTVALTLASLAFMVPLGVSSAASARVGNLVGAGKPWGRAALTAIGLGMALMLVFGAAFLGMPRLLASWFVDGPEAIALAAILLPVAAGFGLFDAIQVVTFGVLRGAGDTAVPAIANVVGYYVVGLPLGGLLAFGLGLGPAGIWLGLAVALASVAVLLLLRLRQIHRRGGVLVE